MQLVKIKNGKPVTTNREIAKAFGKRHKNVLKDIEQIGCSTEFARLNFEPTYYIDSWNRKQTEYEVTKDGFTMLAMGYNGARAM